MTTVCFMCLGHVTDFSAALPKSRYPPGGLLHVCLGHNVCSFVLTEEFRDGLWFPLPFFSYFLCAPMMEQGKKKLI